MEDLKTGKMTEVKEAPREVPPGARLVRVWGGKDDTDQGLTLKRQHPKLSRNAKCPCGSGRKFKHCHDGGVAWSTQKPVDPLDPPVPAMLAGSGEEEKA